LGSKRVDTQNHCRDTYGHPSSDDWQRMICALKPSRSHRSTSSGNWQPSS